MMPSSPSNDLSTQFIGSDTNPANVITVVLRREIRVNVCKEWCLRTFKVKKSCRDDKRKMIIFNDITADIFDAIHTNQAPPVSNRTVWHLFRIAVKYNVDTLFTACIQFISNHNPEYVLEWVNILAELRLVHYESRHESQRRKLNDVFGRYLNHLDVPKLLAAAAPTIDIFEQFIKSPELHTLISVIIFKQRKNTKDLAGVSRIFEKIFLSARHLHTDIEKLCFLVIQGFDIHCRRIKVTCL